ncbi:hypothetical protein ACFFJY_10460 [Fictibacillus aquaticus]|uniref:Uncharacterized protein n=1 Tax=Fictibacillus aquaticus TaxID=2021314 RepID=A0A235FBV8_9BACL|nr:hypothetical protein [Fictibacillus aquaticus]OYD58679.1 hypothetical protein CGZ90_01905 [Fictibacillus aquaticus]
MFSIFLIILTVAMIIQGIKKHVLRIPDKNPEIALKELEKQEWFIVLCHDPEKKGVIEGLKKDGPLSNADSITRLIRNEGAREGFIRYIEEKST